MLLDACDAQGSQQDSTQHRPISHQSSNVQRYPRSRIRSPLRIVIALPCRDCETLYPPTRPPGPNHSLYHA
jgi:hypothetical protein